MSDPVFDYWMRTFKRIGPLVDDGWDGAGWKPSELLVIGYCMVSTSQVSRRADAWATMMLTKAKQRYREGHSANPFSLAPMARAA